MRKGKGQRQNLGKFQYFRNWQRKTLLQKEVELEQPERLKASGDSDVTEATGSRLGLHLLLPDEEEDLGGARDGAH